MTISIATAISIPALFQSYPICLQFLRIRHLSVFFKMYFELCAIFSNCGFELSYLCVNVISGRIIAVSRYLEAPFVFSGFS